MDQRFPAGRCATRRRIGHRLRAILLLASTTLALAFTCGYDELILELEPSPDPVSMTSDATTALVGGRVRLADLAKLSLTLNGHPIPVAADATFWSLMPLVPGSRLHPVVAELHGPWGMTDRDRVVVITGDSVPDGEVSPRSVALRINTTGLERIGPQMSSLIDFDLAELLPHKKKVSSTCLIDAGIGCAGRAKVKIDNPPPEISGWSIELEPGDGVVDALISAHDLKVHLQLNGSGLVPDCNFRVKARRTDILGTYLVSPDPTDPFGVRVEQQGPVDVGFLKFDVKYTGGACDVPILEDIYDRVFDKLDRLIGEGLEDYLEDPDGAGPEPAPIAEAIESALDDVEIAGPLGLGLGVGLETPLVGVRSEPGGILFELDAMAFSQREGGLAACEAPPGALELGASFHTDADLPPLGALTPEAGLPFDLGLAIGSSAFNQLLKARTECGLLHEDLQSLGAGGGGAPLTAGMLSSFITAFGRLRPETALAIALRPRHAPFLTPGWGPDGEVGQLEIADLRVLVMTYFGKPLLEIAVDAQIGLELAFDGAGESLQILPGPLAPERFALTVLGDAVGVDEEELAAIVPEVFATALTGLTDGLGSLPLPRLLDLETRGVEITRLDDAIGVFLDWVPIEETPPSDPLPGLSFKAMTFNVGTTRDLAHDAGDDPYTRDHAEIADELYENSLSWNPAEAALREFIDLHRPEVLAFQELYYDPWCENIPVDPSLDFVCQAYQPGRDYQIQRVLGPDYQVACMADVSVSVTDPDGQPDNCVAVRRDFGHFPECADSELCIDAVVGLPPPDGCTRRSRLGSIEVELLDGRRFTLVNIHATSGIDSDDRACRKQQFKQVFVDRGDGLPAAYGELNLVMGDINTDPFTAGPLDESAEKWNDFVGSGKDFDYLSPDSASGPASYLGLFHVDHVVSDGMLGSCVIPGVSGGTTPVMDVVYWDHSPVLCDVLLPGPEGEGDGGVEGLPEGDFQIVVVDRIDGILDPSGPHATRLANVAIDYDFVVSPNGKVSGTGAADVDDDGVLETPFDVSGKLKTKNDGLLNLALDGQIKSKEPATEASAQYTRNQDMTAVLGNFAGSELLKGKVLGTKVEEGASLGGYLSIPVDWRLDFSSQSDDGRKLTVSGVFTTGVGASIALTGSGIFDAAKGTSKITLKSGGADKGASFTLKDLSLDAQGNIAGGTLFYDAYGQAGTVDLP